MKESFQYCFNRDWKNILLSCCGSRRRDPATVLLLLIAAHSVVVSFTDETRDHNGERMSL
jgi:hypothetical protein